MATLVPLDLGEGAVQHDRVALELEVLEAVRDFDRAAAASLAIVDA